LGNFIMKVNLKCDGINHSARDSVSHFTEPLQAKLKDMMILGADVTHPSLASIEGCPSIAAIVGPVDNHSGRFLGSMRLQNQERKDREPKNGASKPRSELPARILSYRDRVSEGYFGKVVRDEVSAIQSPFGDFKTEKK
ncbi:hypothetical protein EJ02DRAFT_354590, partial [Clathrospora elynae]